MPYIENYVLKSRGSQELCIFDFWLANRSAEQWYKEWFYAAGNPTWELDEFNSLINPGDRILELGSHHGFLTMMLAHKVKPTGFILSIDANPENTLICQAQIALNQLTNICKALPAAATDKPGPMQFAWRTNSHAIVGSSSPESEASYTVEGVTGDDLDREYGPFNVLKVDVEGFEVSVLRGCKELLARRPKLIVELHPTFMKEYGYDDTLDDVYKLLGIEGYEGTMVLRPNFHRSLGGVKYFV